MQEAKYCEDIIPAIKASLEAAGYTNEHDRLGHFESHVPADTFFGLASNHHEVRLFGLQFKAPDAHLRWDLTHTQGQFETLRAYWSSVIYYALPWYTDLADSWRGLELCAFLDSSTLPDEPVGVVRGDLPLPDEYLARLLCGFCVHTTWPNQTDDNEILPKTYRAILTLGPAEFVSKCLLAYREEKPEALEGTGIAPEHARSIAIFLKDAPFRNILDWNSGPECTRHHHFARCMAARVLVSVQFQGKSAPLTFAGQVRVEELEPMLDGPYLGWAGFPGMVPLKKMYGFDGQSPHLSWGDVLSRIDDGSLGVALTGLDLGKFKDRFSQMLARDQNSLLVWYSHVERVFYAVETKRLFGDVSRESLGFMHDPLVAGLPPGTRTRLAKAARSLGMTPAALLEKIIEVFFVGRGD